MQAVVIPGVMLMAESHAAFAAAAAQPAASYLPLLLASPARLTYSVTMKRCEQNTGIQVVAGTA